MAVLGGASASHYPARRLAGGGLRALEGSQPPPLALQDGRNQNKRTEDICAGRGEGLQRSRQTEKMFAGRGETLQRS